MEKTKVQNYMNPITFEAEMFVNSLQALSTTYNRFDVNLVNSLEKVMLAIDSFFDQSTNEIVATENTKLVACDDIMHIKRIYNCTRCKTDLGKSAEKVILHLTSGQCGQAGGSKQSSEAISSRRAAAETDANNQDDKISKSEVHKEKRQAQAEKRVVRTVKLSKKTKSLLTNNFDMVKCWEIGEKLKCIPAYDIIENDLLALITPLFPKQPIKVYRFGSRLSGIGTRASDLDLFLDIGDTFNTYQNRASEDTLRKLHKVSDALKSDQKSWKSLRKVDKARVPILTITHISTDIICDINFSNSLGNVNTQFLEYIFELQPIARFICIFLKKWVERIQMKDSINTYSIILMVIFHLQNLDILPAINKFQQSINIEKAATVGPWLCSYATLTLKQLNIQLAKVSGENVLRLIQGFFKFYINFNFKNELVCPYLGKKIKRTDFDKLMPKRYTKYVQTSPNYALQLDKPIVVQDPIQLNHNVTKGLSQTDLQFLKEFMSKSLDVLKCEYSTKNN